jgi:hypothetical protein
MSDSDSSVELSDEEYAELLASGPVPLVTIKQDVLDSMKEEEMDTVEPVEITPMVCTTVPILFFFSLMPLSRSVLPMTLLCWSLLPSVFSWMLLPSVFSWSLLPSVFSWRPLPSILCLTEMLLCWSLLPSLFRWMLLPSTLCWAGRMLCW